MTLAILGGFTITIGPPATAQGFTPPSRLGATDGRQPIAPPIAPLIAPTIEAADEQHRQRAELTASRLLDTARKDRAEGHPDIAQRVLEVLIARYPDSAHADTARRELFEIYSANRKVAGNGAVGASPKSSRGPRAAAITEPAPTVQPPPPPSPAPAAQAGPSQISASQTGIPQTGIPQTGIPRTGIPQTGGSWQTSVVNLRRLQDDFRNGVGDRVFFDDGSVELGSRARAVIAAQAAWLIARHEIEVVVEGHADDHNARADQDALSRLRANVVRDRLIADGLDPERIKIAALGKRDPIAVCTDSGCAAQNRRAILQIGHRTALQRTPIERMNPAASGNWGTPAGPDAGAGTRRR